MVQVKTIQEVKACYEKSLLKKSGVVSVGIGLNSEGQLSIIIGLDQERPDIISTLPQQLDNFPVCVQVVGTMKIK